MSQSRREVPSTRLVCPKPETCGAQKPPINLKSVYGFFKHRVFQPAHEATQFQEILGEMQAI